MNYNPFDFSTRDWKAQNNELSQLSQDGLNSVRKTLFYCYQTYQVMVGL